MITIMPSVPVHSDGFNTLEQDIRCGKHSGFPDCCIKFYTTDWERIIILLNKGNKEEHKNYVKRMSEKAKMNGKSQWGYIPCPDCLEKENFVETKQCLCCFDALEYRLEKCFSEIISIISEKEKATISMEKYCQQYFDPSDEYEKCGINFNQKINQLTEKYIKKIENYYLK